MNVNTSKNTWYNISKYWISIDVWIVVGSLDECDDAPTFTVNNDWVCNALVESNECHGSQSCVPRAALRPTKMRAPFTAVSGSLANIPKCNSWKFCALVHMFHKEIYLCIQMQLMDIPCESISNQVHQDENINTPTIILLIWVIERYVYKSIHKNLKHVVAFCIFCLLSLSLVYHL